MKGCRGDEISARHVREKVKNTPKMRTLEKSKEFTFDRGSDPVIQHTEMTTRNFL